MATSGTITGSVTNSSGATNSNYIFTAEWKRNSYSIENNTSNITVTLQIKYTYSTNGAYNLDKLPKVSLTINGESKTPNNIYNIDTRNNKICTFATWTGNVTHKDDGSLSCPISASFEHTGSTTLKTGSVSGNAALDTIPRASTITSASNITLGNACSIKWTPASTNFKYKLKFSIGNWSYTTGFINPSTTSAYTYTGYTIYGDTSVNGTTIYAQMSNSASGTMTATLTTYDSAGTQIGSSNAKTFTVSIPSSADPTAGTVSVDPVNVNGYDILLKGKNKITVTASNFKAGTSASIVSYRFDVLYGSTVIETLTTTSSTATLGPFNQNGDVSLKFQVTMTDSRGKTASNYTTLTCYNYDTPYFSSFNAYRASKKNSSYVADVNGTYLKCDYTPVYSSVDSNNQVTVTVYYNEKSSNSTTINLGETDKTYNVYLTITDKYGGFNKTSTITVFGQSRVLNVTSDGTGVAIGKMSEKTDANKDGLFECAFDANFYKNITLSKPLSMQSGGTGSIDAYGLGTKGVMLTSADNLDTIKTNGWYQWSWSDKPANLPSDTGAAYMRSLRVWTTNGIECCQELMDETDSPYHGCMMRRTFYSSAAYPWEWVNPPMIAGIEYRTTERWNGKPVYTQVVSFGALPNNTNKHINHGISNMNALVSYSAYASTGSTDRVNIIGVYYIVDLRITNTTIQVQTNADMSAWTGCYFTLKYTKTTD